MSIVTKNGKRSDSTDLVRADAAASRTAPNESASVPRANLLPPEIGQRNRAKKTRRHMRMALVGIVIVAVGATGGAFAYNSLAQTRLAVAQSDATRLAAEQAKFGEVKAIQDHITLGAAARKVGGATDIDWSDYLSQLEAALPAGVTVDSI
ncbi:MAG: hypothetical protein INR66_20955, partial [Gordonia polyisoprenivorans]|nr:hypothetical protein [Gordonia polyisoprenivorans]